MLSRGDTVKKKCANEDFYFVSKCTVAIVVLLAVLFSMFFLSRKLFYDKIGVETLYEDTDNVTVVLDAGHGGADGGASVGGVNEKDINLQIVKKISDFLSVFDVNVVFTRSEDKLLADDDSIHKKQDDLFNRVRLTKELDEPIFVSIHTNNFSDKQYKGLQVFYSPNHPYSEALALIIQSNNSEYLECDNSRKVKKSSSSIYVLDRLFTPAVLIECGFLSNDDDRAKLSNEDYQNKLAFVIANSIIEYIKL